MTWELPTAPAPGFEAADGALPAGWRAHKDAAGTTYYFSTAGEVVWERPAAPEAGAEEAAAAPLPAGWDSATDKDGDVYYWPTADPAAVVWTRPTAPAVRAAPLPTVGASVTAPATAPLPPGWLEATDPADGMLYYYRADDPSAVVWERPTS